MLFTTIECPLEHLVGGGFGTANLSSGGLASKLFLFPKPEQPIERLTVGLAGLYDGFQGSDHKFGEITLRALPWFYGPEGGAHIQIGLRDFTGNWDDSYKGVITAVTLAQPMPAAQAALCSTMLKIDNLMLRQSVGFYRSWRVFDPGIPPRANEPTSIRLILTYNYTQARRRFTQVAGSMYYDSGARTFEQDQGASNVNINWRGKTTLSFQLAAHECHNLVAVRFQAFGWLRYQTALTSYIFGTVLPFTL
jgi:hypothetical protein